LPVGAQPPGPAGGHAPGAAGAAPLATPPTHVRGSAPGGGAPLPYAPPAHTSVPAPRPPDQASGPATGPYATGAAAGPYVQTAPAGPYGPGGGVRLAPFDAPATALALPVPRVDALDPNAGFLAGLMASAPAELITALHTVPAPSLETRLRELRARLEMREADAAARALTTLEGEHADDWRVVWYRGVTSLVTGDHETAALSFDAVYDAFPGETAPKLALGICAEVLGQLDNAAEYYRLVWATDPGFVSAAFGLARVQIAAGERGAAVSTLESVPGASIHYTAARVAAIRARLRERSHREPLLADLTAAGAQVTALDAFGLDPVRHEQLSTEVLGKALDWVLSGSPGVPGPGGPDAGPPVARKLLGAEPTERGLRFGLERSYRMLARLAQRGDERIELVERANRFRPRTWV
ncbi:tetratricopeptide repeat protein, partial [Streptomyces sp. EN23]